MLFNCSLKELSGWHEAVMDFVLIALHTLSGLRPCDILRASRHVRTVEPPTSTEYKRLQLTWGLNPRDVFTLRINSYSDGRHLPMYANSRPLIRKFLHRRFCTHQHRCRSGSRGHDLVLHWERQGSPGNIGWALCAMLVQCGQHMPLRTSDCLGLEMGFQDCCPDATGTASTLRCPGWQVLLFAGQVLKIEVCQHPGQREAELGTSRVPRASPSQSGKEKLVVY